MTREEVARMMDVSAVQAQSTREDIRFSAEVAIKYGCIAVFALPAHTRCLLDLLEGSNVFAGGVIGFPGGAETTSIKAATARELSAMGCRELDMVENIAWLKAGDKQNYLADVRAVVEAGEGRPVKVILECPWLTPEEIVRACEWCVEAGASWVKTGTGWTSAPAATAENVMRMKKTVGDRCRVKAAGGVRTVESIRELYACGARRFGVGAKSAAAILEQL